jgi:carbamoyl-phosphate synthase large subunit
MIGYNEPDVLIRHHVFGEEIPVHFPYDTGLVMRSVAETLILNADYPVARI